MLENAVYKISFATVVYPIMNIYNFFFTKTSLLLA